MRVIRLISPIFPILLILPTLLASDTNGPTINLHYGEKEAAPNPVADFMYFVPLISPDPMVSLTSPGDTQLVRLLSAKRHFSRHSFDVTCEVELAGDGWQQNIFDLSAKALRKHGDVKEGECLARQLKSIEIRGAGAITVEVEGAVKNGTPEVREVRLHFNAHGHASPVTIDLCDLHRIKGEFKPGNELVARVNTLTFRRQEGPPKMEVSVASVKHKEAGDGFWSNLRGRVTGVAVNMLIDPLVVQPGGHQAMLDFGQALVSGAPTFTFPLATNLETNLAR